MSNFIMIPVEVVMNYGLSERAMVTYGLVQSLCNHKGFCWATNGYLGKILGVGIRTVTRALAELKNAGLIVYEGYPGDGQHSRRMLRVNAPAPVEDAAPSQTVAEEEAPATEEECLEPTQLAQCIAQAIKAQSAPRQKKGGATGKGKPGLKVRTPLDDAMAQVTDWLENTYDTWPAETHQEVCALMGEFLGHRERLGCPLRKGRGLAALCDRLATLSGGSPGMMVDILTLSVMKGWRNLVLPTQELVEELGGLTRLGDGR